MGRTQRRSLISHVATSLALVLLGALVTSPAHATQSLSRPDLATLFQADGAVVDLDRGRGVLLKRSPSAPGRELGDIYIYGKTRRPVCRMSND